jgi:hypothetical protein
MGSYEYSNELCKRYFELLHILIQRFFIMLATPPDDGQ